MLLAKEDEVFVVLGSDGSARLPREGVFRRDTCYLATWSWTLQGSEPLSLQSRGATIVEHRAITSRTRTQLVGCERRLTVLADGFRELLILRNTSAEPQTVTLELEAAARFADVMARWVAGAEAEIGPAHRKRTRAGLRWSRTAVDGVKLTADLSLTPAPDGEDLKWTITLAPGHDFRLEARVRLAASDDAPAQEPLPSYDAWRASFRPPRNASHRPAWAQAVDDIRMLLLSTEHGPYPAAGAPNFVNIFGRDAILTSYMLLGARPDLARSVLRFLAAHQGMTVDPFREEEPGKILHEIRRGELSRTGRIPFGRYYGSIDATPLFVVLLEAYVERTGDRELARELGGAWRAALDFIVAHQGANDGLLTFEASGSGLSVQSWKDSPDSMNHADGRPAEPPLAVAEVQGYAVAALRAGAALAAAADDAALAADYQSRAEQLSEALHARFWLEGLGAYAMALDREGRPLRVLSSDPGHLLWAGAVPAHAARRLATTLTSPPLWSGWGVRTLAEGEVRYNPVSYHNGSVWPHDTAILAGGLARYGFTWELEMVRHALFDLASSQPKHSLPELVAGFDREPGLAPVPYTHACRPQAWAAAALPYLVELCEG